MNIKKKTKVTIAGIIVISLIYFLLRIVLSKIGIQYDGVVNWIAIIGFVLIGKIVYKLLEKWIPDSINSDDDIIDS